MDSFNIFNVLAGIASIMGAVAVYQFKISQSKKARADLLARLVESIAQKKKRSAGELFYLLHGLRMKFEDIEAICGDSRSSKIVYALRKTPGVVTHVNGRFRYNGMFEKAWVRKVNNILMKTLAYFMAAISLTSIILMVFLEGTKALTLLIVVAPMAAFFQYADKRYSA